MLISESVPSVHETHLYKSRTDFFGVQIIGTITIL